MRRCRPNERREEVSSPNPTCETWNGNPLRRFSRAGRYRPDVDKVKMRESEAGPPAYSRCDCPDLSIARSQPRPRPSVSERRLPLVSFSASRWPCSVETRGREREGGREGRPDERTFSKLSAAIARSSASVHSPLSPSHSLPPSTSPCGRPLPAPVAAPLTTANDRATDVCEARERAPSSSAQPGRRVVSVL